MKILAIADKESPYFWDFFEKNKLEGIDLIISCGDLDPQYLSFLATFATVPLLYVRGNHDDCYEENPPEGCICIEDKIFVYQGVRIMGLGGSRRYRDGKNQYSEWQMRMRAGKMWLPLKWRRGMDILVTHSPALGLNDGSDLAHQGFQTFTDLIEKYQPRYFLHGHVHMSYGRQYPRHDWYKETHIINACERCVFEYEDRRTE